MPAVFVHGNPETPAVWDGLISALGRADTVALALPGFGVPVPEGFGATKEEYVAWLVAELEAIGEPIDLVGHDWGGGFVLRVACLRPDLLRSWAADVAGLLDPSYVWHDLAQVWQADGAGEEFMAGMLAQSPAERAGLYEGLGIGPAAARSFAEALDERMADCVLKLYRSAIQPAMAAWGADAEQAAARPGLVIAPAEDPYAGGTGGSERMAARLGASVEVLDGLGHWWMQQDPARGAAMLEAFWAGLG